MLKLNNIYNMDCIEGLKQIDGNTIDLIVTSPPYNCGIDYDTYNDNMPYDEYLNWMEEWLKECYRVLKDDGRICINHYIAYSPKENNIGVSRFPLMDIRNIMMNIGYNVHKIAIWDDITCVKFTAWGSWMSASAPNIMTPYEGILIACKNQWEKINKGESTIDKQTFQEGVSGVWHLGTTIGYTTACFPEKLPKMCIELLTYKDDVVLDPFSGSGTTCYVAKALNRRFIGFEISKNYWEESISRLNGSPYQVKKVNKEKCKDYYDLFNDESDI